VYVNVFSGHLFMSASLLLSLVVATPFVPAHRRPMNRRMRVLIRCYRAFLRAGHLLNVRLPMSEEFISVLKRKLGFSPGLFICF
jgi:hypothetical protein